MINQLIERDISCPYCGEVITILIDDSVQHQEYIEDCQVCCRPIEFEVWANEGDISIQISSDH